MPAEFDNALSHLIWRDKYRHRRPDGVELSIEDSWQRVASAVASVEPRDQADWAERFHAILENFEFLPGGRILAGAGTAQRVTLLSCFVQDLLTDSIGDIFERLRETAVTMEQGGGVGCDFSPLPPRGAAIEEGRARATGPIAYMQLWDAMCSTVLATAARRGAMIGTLRCDHPDIEAFIDAKRQPGSLTNFNLSVQITNDFLRCLDTDGMFPLVFPWSSADDGAETLEHRLPGYEAPVLCTVHRRVRARELWRRLTDAAHATGEPGLLFVDRVNARNNLHYRERISATNPCGEIPLPPSGACDLGSINLAAFVDAPFSSSAELALDRIAATVRTAVRFLDDVLDLSRYPLAKQAEAARGSRRIGLGVTGLADALIMLGLPYSSDAARAQAAEVLTLVRDEAYRASIGLAREKGAFPHFERGPYLASAFIDTLPNEIRDAIAIHGIRNSHLLAIAPTGSISVLANNVSSGIEPVYARVMQRRIRERDGRFAVHEVADFAYALWRAHAGADAALPSAFETALEIEPEAHLRMQAELQPLVDNSIAKTVNVRADMRAAEFAAIYERAIALGLNGLTVFRVNPITGSVLAEAECGSGPCGVEAQHPGAADGPEA